MQMAVPVAGLPPGIVTACIVCSGAAFFQARAQWPRGRTRVSRHASACADHVVEAIQLLRAWGHDCQLTDGWLTVLAIDPHASRGTAAPGLPFYSAPLVTPGVPD